MTANLHGEELRLKSRTAGSASDMLCEVDRLLNLSEADVDTGQDAAHDSSQQGAWHPGPSPGRGMKLFGG